MIRFRNSLPLVAAVLVGATTLTSPPPARAAFAVRVFDDGVLQGGIGVLVVGNSLVFTGSTTNFSITNGSGLSNNPGTPGGSNLDLASNEQISTTFGAAGGTHTIRIELSQNSFVAPTGTPLTLSSSAGGSISYLADSNPNATQSVLATYQGFLDNTNTLFGQPGTGSTPLQSASASLSAVGTAPLLFSPNPAAGPVPGGTPFSMTDVLEFTFTLSAGSGPDTANVSASTTATGPAAADVPEPATLGLALMGLAPLGVMGLRRLRRRPAGA